MSVCSFVGLRFVVCLCADHPSIVAQVLGAFQQLQLMSMDNLTDDERIALLTEMSQVRFALLCFAVRSAHCRLSAY